MLAFGIDRVYLFPLDELPLELPLGGYERVLTVIWRWDRLVLRCQSVDHLERREHAAVS